MKCLQRFASLIQSKNLHHRFRISALALRAPRDGADRTVPAQKNSAAVQCFFLISAGIFLVKYFINQSRVELLKELQQIELQVLEPRETPKDYAYRSRGGWRSLRARGITKQ